MKSNATKWLFSLLVTTVLMSASVFASIDSTDTGGGSGSNFSEIFSDGPRMLDITDNNTIIVKSTDKTKKVYIPSRNRSYTSGTFKGTQDGNTIKFYCIDINTGLKWNSEYTYDGETSVQLSYVLNNYYPFAGRQFSSGSLYLSETEEAAATQLAIWHFSDNIDISNSTPANVLAAAQTIIADANANAVTPNKTIVINIPNNQTFKVGEPIKFLVEVYNEYNAPEPGVTVNLSATGGNLSQAAATTNSTGVTDTLQITQSGAGSATITAKGEVMLSVGARFVKKGAPNSSQKLVLASPAKSEVEVSSTVNWYGEPDLTVSKTGSVQTVSHGDQVTYTITVQNKTTASAAATDVKVSDVLPSELTSVSTSGSGSYDINSGIWSVGDLAVGESKTLTITATVDLNSSGNSGFGLGPAADYNLFVLNNIKEARSDTEGKIAVGRDAVFHNYSVGDKLSPNSGDVLIVNRKLTFNTGRVYNGQAVYGNFIDTTHANLADGGIRKEKNVIDFSYAKTYLKNLSKQLFAITPNGTVTHDGYGRLDFVGTNDTLNVFLVDKATSSLNINHYSINIPEGSLAIINYAGKNLTFQSAGYEVNGVSASGETNETHRKVGSKILLNFYQAKNLNVLGGIGILGSILAPNASLTYEIGVIYGQVIVENVIKAHQFNWVQFDGEIKIEKTITNVAEILSYNEINSQMDNDPGVNFSFASMEAQLITDIDPIDSDLPEEFELQQNYPNPFNPSTVIDFSVPSDGNYKISVYNIVGQKVAELLNKELAAGKYSVKFNGSSMASGIYFYKLEGKGVNITRKMIMIK
ncbi:MAG: choice-of-anchor A family protein [Rhodothermaceae bacterium]